MRIARWPSSQSASCAAGARISLAASWCPGQRAVPGGTLGRTNPGSRCPARLRFDQKPMAREYRGQTVHTKKTKEGRGALGGQSGYSRRAGSGKGSWQGARPEGSRSNRCRRRQESVQNARRVVRGHQDAPPLDSFGWHQDGSKITLRGQQEGVRKKNERPKYDDATRTLGGR